MKFALRAAFGLVAAVGALASPLSSVRAASARVSDRGDRAFCCAGMILAQSSAPDEQGSGEGSETPDDGNAAPQAKPAPDDDGDGSEDPNASPGQDTSPDTAEPPGCIFKNEPLDLLV